MITLRIPIKAAPAQTLDTVVNGQYVSISLQSRDDRMYASVWLDKAPVVLERVCLDGAPLVNEAYRGMIGELYFIDTLGPSDLGWELLGTRFVLIYHLKD